MPAKALRSIARRWPIGWVAPPLHSAPSTPTLLEGLKSSTKLFADETTAPVLDPGRGRTKTGQLWANARDHQPWSGLEPPAAFMRPTAITSGRPSTLRASRAPCRSMVMAPMPGLPSTATFVLAFCWSQVRRRFYEIKAHRQLSVLRAALQANRAGQPIAPVTRAA